MCSVSFYFISTDFATSGFCLYLKSNLNDFVIFAELKSSETFMFKCVLNCDIGPINYFLFIKFLLSMHL